jgi:hypothetical protein
VRQISNHQVACLVSFVEHFRFGAGASAIDQDQNRLLSRTIPYENRHRVEAIVLRRQLFLKALASDAVCPICASIGLAEEGFDD